MKAYLTEEQILNQLDGCELQMGIVVDRGRDSDKSDKTDRTNNSGYAVEDDVDIAGGTADIYGNNVTFDE